MFDDVPLPDSCGNAVTRVISDIPTTCASSPMPDAERLPPDEEVEDDVERSIFGICLHSAHGSCFETDALDSPEGVTRQSRPCPLPLDLEEALGQATQAEEDRSQPRSGMRLLLQVCRVKERALGWRLGASPARVPPPLEAYLPHVPSSSSAAPAPFAAVDSEAIDGRVPSAEALAHFTLSFRIPLLLSSVMVVDGETAIEWPESRSQEFEKRYLLAIVTKPASSSVTALQGLQLSNASLGGKVRAIDPNGTWLLECKDEGDRRALLGQLQLAGCIMNDIGARYRVGELLGVGASSKVFLAEDYSNGEEVAVKIVTKKGVDKDLALLKEATILRWAIHDCVLQFRGIYDILDPATGHGAWAIVTEFVGGGELFEEVRKKGPFDEGRACDVMTQLLSALDFLHHRGIVHRDIKTENVCKTGYGDEIKLVDFGLASLEWDTTAMLTRCGSPGYIAPEVLRGEHYGCKVDCFSVGVLMYILLVGWGPFRGGSLEEMLTRNARCKVNLKDLVKQSPAARDLVSKLLVPKSRDRPSADECLAHQWIATSSALTSCASEATAVAPAALPSARRGRRRLFSTQLDCGDMFHKHLKFAEEIGESLGSAPLGQADASSADVLSPGQVEVPIFEQQSIPLDSAPLEPPIPAPLPPAPLPFPSEGQESAKSSTRTRPQSPSGSPPDIPFQMTVTELPAGQEASEKRPPRPEDGPAAEGGALASPSAGALDSGRRMAPSLSVDMLRTCEPLWADVQRTLTELRGQGVLSPDAGLQKAAASSAAAARRPYARGRAVTRPAEERKLEAEETQERKSAYFCRDLHHKMSGAFSNSSSNGPGKTSFFKRDATRHDSDFSSQRISRHSFNSGQSCEERPGHSEYFMMKTKIDGEESEDEFAALETSFVE
mmetsp:Transcript_72027/g.206732  ORF Transcript_72027/g.206732 Transcript_72027/m.206732 type:complete len:892 (+) Transcript_72027:48-2723(+)